MEQQIEFMALFTDWRLQSSAALFLGALYVEKYRYLLRE
jgi:hypothetical protein